MVKFADTRSVADKILDALAYQDQLKREETAKTMAYLNQHKDSPSLKRLLGGG